MNAMVEDKGAGSSDQCDSGWTSYLQHSSYSYYSLPSPPCNNNHRVNKSYRDKKMVSKEGVHETDNAGDFCQKPEVEVEEEEEDLSMVSDASSGPPHFDLNDVGGDRNINRQYIGSHNCKFEHRCEGKDFAHLDDTASSPLFFSPKVYYHHKSALMIYPPKTNKNKILTFFFVWGAENE
uniref:Uncharacterized protein n=1 Tax=Opuntia streptacantha TaxID=393608 RepID=A0A7C8YSC2_OPUST